MSDLIFPAQPDLSSVSGTQLSNPVEGQLWFNKSNKHLYIWKGTMWVPLTNRNDYAANWGQIQHGQALPRPVSVDGYIFEYDECIWNTSPAVLGKFDNFVCFADSAGMVTSQYRPAGANYFVDGVANYLIIGIRGNLNSGIVVAPPIPSPTPTTSPTSTPGPSVTPTPGASPTPTPTLTPTVTVSATRIYETPAVTATPTGTAASTPTPTPSVTPTIGVSVTATPGPTASPTPTVTRTPTRTVTPTPTPPASPGVTPPVTPTRTPAVTPTPTVTPTPSVAPPMVVTIIDDESGSDASELSAYCNIANYSSANRDMGYNGCGATSTSLCSATSCSPEPGDSGLGPTMRAMITGGVAPYTVRLKNFLPDNSGTLANPSFESGDTGWIKESGWYIAADGSSYSGSICALFTGSGTNIGIINTTTPPVTAGQYVSANMYANNDDGSGDYMNTGLIWYNSSMGEIGRSYGNRVQDGEAWQLSTVYAPAPTGAAFVRMGMFARKTHGYACKADLASWSFASQSGTPECFFVGGSSVPSLPYAGTVKTYTVPQSGQSTPIISLNGICNSLSFAMLGLFDFEVMDAVGTTQTITKKFNISRVNYAGGGGDPPPACVTTTSMIYGAKTAGDVRVGDDMVVVDPVLRAFGTGIVSYAEVSQRDCVRVTSASGVVLECSLTAPLSLPNGDKIVVTETYGKTVLLVVDGIIVEDTVTELEYIGYRDVMNITCENNYFAAGTVEGSYFLHHNLIKATP